MLKQLWQWFKRLFRRVFRTAHPSVNVQAPVKPQKQWTDAEYESLFLELLEGVNEGWSRGKVKGFLAARNVVEATLLQWLQGFGERLLASDVPNDELAARMVRLAELDVGEVGKVARDIGLELAGRNGREDREEEYPKINLSKLFTTLQQDLSSFRRFKEAIACFDEALEIKSDEYKAWLFRGLTVEELTSRNKLLDFSSPIACSRS
jgi:hypothetical protein